MKKLVQLFSTAYGRLNCGASCLQSPLLFIMRLYWGWSFFQTGKGKLMNISKPTEFFQSLGIPFPHEQAILAGCTECFGGLLLLLGLASRLTCIPLTIVMIVAYVTADNEALRAIYSDTDKFTSAAPFLFLLTVLIVLAFGPGVFSIDWLISKKCCRKKNND
jgi:putative oxidoreductase